jgi:hypothetical protein
MGLTRVPGGRVATVPSAYTPDLKEAVVTASNAVLAGPCPEIFLTQLPRI